MKKMGLIIIVALCSLSLAFAAELETVVDAKAEHNENTITIAAQEAYWIFSGSVTNENAEPYHYYFQMQRKENQFQSLAVLINDRSKELVLYEQNSATLEVGEVMYWRVGKSFLQFNPINNSWSFGVKAKNHNGFNFKVDMIEQTHTASSVQNLRSGIDLLVNQTGRLNGHIQAGELEKEQFVTAQKAWFKQIWVSQSQNTLHPLTSVLCQFNDGSGFYSVNLQEADALRGAVAGWKDKEGSALPMSQFVTIKEAPKGEWEIAVSSPKVSLILQDVLALENENHHLVAGLTQGEKPGLCVISKDNIG